MFVTLQTIFIYDLRRKNIQRRHFTWNNNRKNNIDIIMPYRAAFWMNIKNKKNLHKSSY